MLDLAAEFPQDQDLIYLNHAGVAPWPRRCVQAIREFAEENLRRGARDYPRWLERELALRRAARQLLNAESEEEIALLKNTSEALSVVAHGLDWQPGDNLVISNQEFPSNRIVWESLRDQGVETREADISGADPEQALFECCDVHTRLISVSAVQYASGLRLDLARIGEFCRSRGILFCVDAIQQLGALAFDARAIQADLVMADGHKWLLGPEGLALFYCRAELRERLNLRQYGWHMVENHLDFERRSWRPANHARRFECGSPNMLGVFALHASLSLLLEIGMEQVQNRVLANSALLIDLLRTVPGLEILSPLDPARCAGIVTFRHLYRDNTELFQKLTAAGVVCAARGGGIRFSPHFYTPEQTLRDAVAWITRT